MTYFYRVVRRLCLFLSILTTVAVYSGHQQPLKLALLFVDPDGRPCQIPCFLGIQPGETSYEQAMKLVQAHPYTRNFVPLTLRAFGDHHFTLLLAITATRRVSEIDLIRLDTTPEQSWGSLGEFVAILGAPDRVQVVKELGGNFITAVYLTHNLLARFRLRTPTYADADLQLISVSTWQPIVSLDMSAWVGFSNRYPDIPLFP